MTRIRPLDRRTKIVCTIGPATGSAPMIEGLIRAGMDVARLNLSHGTFSEHSRLVQTIRDSSLRLGISVGILIDLPGPKYRTGRLKCGEATLRQGSQIVLTARQVEGDATLVQVLPPDLHEVVRTGDTIILDDGAIRLRVVETAGTEVMCRVVVGGRLTGGRGLAVPGRASPGPFVTESLRECANFAVGQEPDYLALSFVGTADDVAGVRAVLGDDQSGIAIVAKIERGQAVANFDAILSASDGVMVARGDLGVDIPLERVPLVQKEIVRKCNRAGKPVITATEMLQSMVSAARPTRAEVTDVANAIFDGTDATMLSAETAIGRYPVQAVRMMARIARQAEKALPYGQILAERGTWLEHKTDELISYSACQTAYNLGAAAIVAFTHSGSTARRVSKYRPPVPIVAVTPSTRVASRLLLRWGVYPCRLAGPPTVDEMFATGARLCKELGVAKSGDLIVITAGIPVGIAGSTNLLKVERVQ